MSLDWPLRPDDARRSLSLLSRYAGVDGILIMNAEGVVLRSTLRADMANQASALTQAVTSAARTAVRELSLVNFGAITSAVDPTPSFVRSTWTEWNYCRMRLGSCLDVRSAFTLRGATTSSFLEGGNHTKLHKILKINIDQKAINPTLWAGWTSKYCWDFPIRVNPPSKAVTPIILP